MKNVVIPLSSVQLLNLSTAYVLLLPQPGKGYAWMLHSLTTVFTPGAAAYTAGSQVDRFYGTASPSHLLKAFPKQLLTDNALKTFVALADLAQATAFLTSEIDNKAVILLAAGPAFASGNGTAVCSVLANRVKLF